MQEERILVLEFISSVTTRKLVELFVPPFFHLLNGDNPSTSLDGHERKQAWEETGTVPGMQKVLAWCSVTGIAPLLVAHSFLVSAGLPFP